MSLTLGEPVLGSLLVVLVDGPAFTVTVGALVQHTVLESLAEDAQHFIVHQAIPLELLVRLELADEVIRVALVDGGHSAELLVVPRVLLLVWLDDGFWGQDELCSGVSVGLLCNGIVAILEVLGDRE